MTANGKPIAAPAADRTAANGSLACSLSQRERAGVRENGCEVSGVTTTPRILPSLSLHRMRGEGRGEEFRASAPAAPPLIRPAATFSPPSRKGEGAACSIAEVSTAYFSSLSQRERAGVRENGCEVSGVTTTPRILPSLSLHRMRGEGRGEGFRASAPAAPPLIRPAATFSPPPRKGEGAFGGLRLASAKQLSSLSLHRMRGEGWGEGFRASAQAAPPLIRPAATFSPPPRKGEGAFGGLRLASAKQLPSLSRHRMRGEGRGEGFRASAPAVPPLIRPAATFSPPPRKGEGAYR